MPDIEFAFLADAAQVQPGQKFHVLGGGISRVTGPTLPFIHPHLSLVLGLRLPASERDREHELGVVLEAPDNSQVATATGKFVPHGSAPADDVMITIAIDLWNLDLRVAGEHFVRISIDGSERKRLSLMVAQLGTQMSEQKYIA